MVFSHRQFKWERHENHVRRASQLIVGAIGQYLISICPLLSPVRAASDFYMAPRERERKNSKQMAPTKRECVAQRESLRVPRQFDYTDPANATLSLGVINVKKRKSR